MVPRFGWQRDLDSLFRLGVASGLTDGQLLHRFLGERGGVSEAAFEALTRRHGPMVLGVCGDVLGDPHDAEDAFQATFLVLARKAASVRKADSVASWLHGVALRVASKARADAGRRRAHERRAATTRPRPPAELREEAWPELHEEIARLPARYREPVVLCYFEGLTHVAAADRIGCAQGTVLSRLSRARERLRRRLTIRGLGCPATFPDRAPRPGALLLPGGLLARTVRASLDFIGSRGAEAVLASPPAATLARGAVHAMTIASLRYPATLALIGAVGLGCLQSFARSDAPGSPTASGRVGVARAEGHPEPAPPGRDEPARRSGQTTNSEFPFALKVEPGATRFREGDKITILEVRGTADTMAPGNIYWIKGTYTLASRDRAMLGAFTTAKDPGDGKGKTLKVQTTVVDKGDGTFTLFLPVAYQGWPHVSFYPADGGEGFGGSYFGTGDTVLKNW